MTSEDSGIDDEILKVDTRGRVRLSADKREGLMDAFERSGMTGTRFAKLHGINYQTFAGWRHRRRKRGESNSGLRVVESSTSVDQLHLAEVVVAPQAKSHVLPTSGLQISLPAGFSVTMTEASQAPLAAALIRELSTPCSDA